MISPRLKATGSLPIVQAPSTRKPSSGLDRDTMSQPWVVELPTHSLTMFAAEIE